MIVFLNGKLVPEEKAHISFRDHGFLYGDGVYETIRVYHGHPFLLYEHLRRLNNSLFGIRLTPPLSLVEIGRAVQRTIKANSHKEAAVRLTITRGVGPYGFDPRYCKPTIIITSMPFKGVPPEKYRRGIRAAVVSVRRNLPEALPPFVKSTSCLNGVLAKIESLGLSADEAILLSHRGLICEGSVSNVFIVKDNVILTPKLEGNFLPGVTRDWVCRLARYAGYRLEEKRLPVKILGSADEVFLTSTLMEVMPVSRLIFNFGRHLRERRLGPYTRSSGYIGPVTLDLMNRFKHSLREMGRLSKREKA